jgi:hypothetical protein
MDQSNTEIPEKMERIVIFQGKTFNIDNIPVYGWKILYWYIILQDYKCVFKQKK